MYGDEMFSSASRCDVANSEGEGCFTSQELCNLLVGV